jgi:hypothetical protein
VIEWRLCGGNSGSGRFLRGVLIAFNVNLGFSFFIERRVFPSRSGEMLGATQQIGALGQQIQVAPRAFTFGSSQRIKNSAHISSALPE